LKELELRLNKIKDMDIIDANYIQEAIADSPHSQLRTIGNTERPDVVASKLLEGRIAIFIDGSPSVLTLPYVFIENFIAADDYYINYYFGSINRLIRIISGILSVSIPAIYIAFVTFHQEMIPTPLLLSIAASRKGVPFPTIVEAVVILLAFEIVREAGTRMPTTMGQSISIVGALILGQASVEAKIFSAPIVIVAAVTGITGLLLPKLKGASILTRGIFILLASVVGLYGFIFGVMGMLLYLFSLRSFGISYMAKSGSINPKEVKDTTIRAPIFTMKHHDNLQNSKKTLS
jgi:spore germination protein KA